MAEALEHTTQTQQVWHGGQATVSSAERFRYTGSAEPVWREVRLPRSTPAAEGGEFNAVSSLGSAIVKLTQDKVVINLRRLKATYETSAPPEKKAQDKGASGSVQVPFEVDYDDYKDGLLGDL